MNRIKVCAAIAVMTGSMAGNCRIPSHCAPTDLSCSLAASFLFLPDRFPKNVFVSSTGGSVFAFSIGGNGTMTALGSVSVGAGLSVSTSDPLDRYLFMPASAANLVNPLVVDSRTGALSSGTSLSVTDAQQVAVTPDGSFLYATSSSGFFTAVTQINRTQNSLTLIENESLGGASLIGVGVHPAGQTLVVTDAAAADRLVSYRINAGGDITQLVALTVTAGSDPNTVTFMPSPGESYFVVPNKSNATLESYHLNTTTGVMTLISSISVPGNPIIARFVPRTSTFFVTHVTNQVTRYVADLNTGVIAAAGSFTVGTQITAIHFDSSGRYAALADNSGGLVHLMRVNGDGTLTAASQMPVTGATEAVVWSPYSL
jgi:6-phosphogluconolactonase (cycloisomerase 2 family)